MSRTVEQKVVEMRFDNSNFEKNVSQSMDSLNRLKATIDKTSSGNAFTGLSKALDNINIGSVTTAIQTVTEKFSVWEQVAIGAARNIGASISNYVVKGMNDMVFRNISAGWDKYATKTEAVQTIMASIADQDFGNVDKMEYVEGLMDKLNWFTDETSFHLTDMISSIGKFTSAGVDLDKASDAMMGIATWAAVSGANADTASRVMYQLSQSLGLGAVRTQDWMSVETANMATKEFKELAIQVAKTKKTLTEKGVTAKGNQVNFQNFRENLKDNWLTSDVLTETLAQYSGFANALNRVYEAYGGNVPTSTLIKRFKLVQAEAKKTGKSLKETFKEKYDVDVNFDITDKEGKVIGDLTKSITELGMRAFIAAQEAKTFKEAMDSVGDAASTVWMRVYETIFGNYEVAKELWTNLANDLYELFVEPIWIASDLFEEWSKQGGRALLFGRQILENDDGTEEIVPTGAFDIFIRGVIDASNALRNGFLTALGYSEDKVSEFTSKTLIKFSQKMLNLSKRFQKFIGNVDDLTEKFSKFFGYFVDIINSIDVFNKKSEDSVYWVGMIKKRFVDTFTRVENVLDRVKSIVGYIKEGFIEFFKALKFNGGSILNFGDTAENLAEVGNDLAKALSPITLIFKEMGEFGKKTGRFISNLVEALSSVPKEITSILRNTELLSWGANVLQETLKAIKTGFNEAFNASIFADIKEAFKEVWAGIKIFIDGFTSNFDIYDKIKTIGKGVASAINLIGRAIQFMLIPIKWLTSKGVFEEIGKFLSGTILNALLSIPAAIAKIISKIDEFISKHPVVFEVMEGLSAIFGSIIRFVFSAANAFSDFIKKTKPLSKLGGFVKDVFDKFKRSDDVSDSTNKIADAFRRVIYFFENGFTFDNAIKRIESVKTKVAELKDTIEDRFSKIEAWFIKLSGIINEFFKNLDDKYQVTQHFEELWNNIKKLFAREDDFEGFGANFMSGFAKGLIDNVDIAIDKIKEVGAKVLQAIKDFFGIHSPSTVMEDVGNDVVSGFAKGITDKIKVPVEAIKKLGKSVYEGLSALLFSNGKTGDLNESAKETEKTSEIVSNIKTGLGNMISKLLGIGAIAIPTVAAVNIGRSLRALMSPFEALEDVAEAFSWKMKGEVIVSGITAIGSSFAMIAKALGMFLLELGAFAVILAVADKISGGKIWTLFSQMAAFIAEVVGGITLLIRGVGGYQKVSGSFEKGVGNAGFTQNKTAENIRSIAEIFESVGKAMLMLAGALAVLSIVYSKYGSGMTEAFKILMVFGGLLLALGFVIAKFTDDETKSFLTLDKSGLAFEHSGWTEGLYAIGTFMTKIGIAMLAIAAAAAIVVKATGGDVDQMHEVFNGIQSVLFIVMGAMVGIILITQKIPSAGMADAANNIKAAGVAIAAVSAAISIIARTVIKLGRAKDADLDKGVSVITKIGLVLLGFSALAAMSPKDTNYKAVGFMAIEIAASMALLGILVKKLGEMKPEEMSAGMRALTTFGIFFGIISTLTIIAASINTDTTKFAAIGFMLMEVSAAFVVMSFALKTLSSVENMGTVIGGLVSSFLALGLLFAVVAGIATIASKMGAGMFSILASAAGLVLIAASVSIIAKAMGDIGTVFSTDTSAFEKALITLGAITLALVALGLVAKVTGPAMLLFGAGMAAVGVGVALLGVGFHVFVNTLLLLAAEMLVFGDTFGKALSKFFDGITESGPSLTKALITLVNAVVEALLANYQGIVTFLGELIIGLLDPLVEYLPTILEKLTVIANAIVDLVLNVLLNAIRTFIFGDNGVLSMLYDGLFAEKGLLAMVHEAFSGEHGLVNRIKDGIKAILAAIRELVPDFLNTSLFVLTEFINFFKEKRQLIYDTITETIIQIADNIVGMADTFFTAIVNLIEGLANAIESHSGDFWGAVKHLVRAIWDSIWGLFSGSGETSMDNLGSNMMEGLGKGLLDHIQNALNAVGNVAKSVWDKFKSVLGINSPSVIAEELAGYVDLGFAKGITDNATPVLSSVSDLGDGIINTFASSLLGDDLTTIGDGLGDNITNMLSDTLGGITDVLETDDFTPTITPVLDLSEIQNGASMIPGMINPDAGYTVNTAMVAKSAYSPYEYYDGSEKINTPEAQMDYFEALKSKMDEVVNKFASAKVVLDTGAVVGGIVGPMDMALGQRMAQVGRGVYSSTR